MEMKIFKKKLYLKLRDIIAQNEYINSFIKVYFHIHVYANIVQKQLKEIQFLKIIHAHCVYYF